MICKNIVIFASVSNWLYAYVTACSDGHHNKTSWAAHAGFSSGMANAMSGKGFRWRKWGPLFMGKRLSCALFLDVVKSGSFKIQSRDKATIDAHGWFIGFLYVAFCGIYVCRKGCRRETSYNHRRGFLCVARSWLDGLMPEPHNVERATGSDSPRFFRIWQSLFHSDYSCRNLEVNRRKLCFIWRLNVTI